MRRLYELASSFLHKLKPASMAEASCTIPPLPPAGEHEEARAGCLKRPLEPATGAEAGDATPHADKKRRESASLEMAGGAPGGGVSSAGMAAEAASKEGPGAAPRGTLEATTAEGRAGLQDTVEGGQDVAGSAPPQVSPAAPFCRPVSTGHHQHEVMFKPAEALPAAGPTQSAVPRWPDVGLRDALLLQGGFMFISPGGWIDIIHSVAHPGLAGGGGGAGGARGRCAPLRGRGRALLCVPPVPLPAG